MRRSKFLVLLILFIWFVISFITNILGPVMPILIDSFKLSLTLAAFLPFSFFLAYGIMSIPAGFMIERFGEKKSMLVAFGICFAGSFLFALLPVYGIALASLFIIGIGMAMLQVIINPLMREVGGEENFAFYSALAQLIFGAASFVSPFFFSFIMKELGKPDSEKSMFISQLSRLVPEALPWSSLYWFFALIAAVMLVVIAITKVPNVNLTEDEKTGALKSYIELLKKKNVILFFIGIMAYVGTEQGIANWMSKFLYTYHHLNPETDGASAVAWFWGLMSVGCLLGLIILKTIDSKLVLKFASVLSVITLSIALFSASAKLSQWAFSFMGFFISLMFSIVFSLALNSEEKHHGSFSGILCTGIFGGALVPLIIGWLGDFMGLRIALLFVLVTLGYIFYIPFWAKPLVNNKTVSLRELFGNKDKIHEGNRR